MECEQESGEEKPEAGVSPARGAAGRGLGVPWSHVPPVFIASLFAGRAFPVCSRTWLCSIIGVH